MDCLKLGCLQWTNTPASYKIFVLSGCKKILYYWYRTQEKKPEKRRAQLPTPPQKALPISSCKSWSSAFPGSKVPSITSGNCEKMSGTDPDFKALYEALKQRNPRKCENQGCKGSRKKGACSAGIRPSLPGK
jgi:hypothetical protein